MKSAQGRSAFTLVESLVAAGIIVVLGTVVAPTTGVDAARAKLTETLSHARQLQIATQMMSLDSVQSGSGIVWTTVTDEKSRVERPATLAEYYGALTNNNYLTSKDLKQLLTAPGRGPGSAAPTAANSCFKFFWVKESSPSDQPLLVTANWTPKGMDSGATPYGEDGFIVFTKGGGGGIYGNAEYATSTKVFPTDPAKGYSLTTLK